MSTAICTWFVSDDAETATFFPQVGSQSDAPKTQAIYWRCILGFYASSLSQNLNARHVFFTNTEVPVIDGLDLADVLAQWGVETVTLPITYRLPKSAVQSWGNQFYIFDIIDWFAENGGAERIVVLDSDCIWLKPMDTIATAIDRYGALTLSLPGEYTEGADTDINGQTRAGMARFLAACGGVQREMISYYGGEIYAATSEMNRRIATQAKRLWPDVVAQGPDAPREEAHLLSIIYYLEQAEGGTANPFMKRMWTTFHHNNVAPTDLDLSVWHLPAEKRTGFADLFSRIRSAIDSNPTIAPEALGLTTRTYCSLMGVPRRSPMKFVRDLSLKLIEKATK